MADYIVVLGLNGRVKHRGPTEEVLQVDSSLQAEIAKKEKELEGADKKEEDESEEATKAKAAAGKLIVAEEVALGRVGWPACERFVQFSFGVVVLKRCCTVRLYMESLGGKGFYVTMLSLLILQSCLPIAGKAFLAYWTAAYENMPQDEVPVRL